MSIIYRLAVAFFRLILSIFFREVAERGSHFIPSHGPGKLILMSSYICSSSSFQPSIQNLNVKFVDPLILFSTCKRRIGFLIAAASMKRRIIGFFARLLEAIPVCRPCDVSHKGSGTISIDPANSCRVVGRNTQFKQEVKDDCCLVLKPEHSLHIERVVDDHEILLKKPCSIKFLNAEYKIMPIIDQSAVYESVHEILRKGGAIGIFPEGGSHDRGQMLPLKAGVTIMALGTMAKHPNVSIKIIPCGLNYFHPDQFRSRAMIEYGKPFEIDAELVEEYKKGGDVRREACSKLLKIIHDRLWGVTINVPDPETLQVIQATRRLYKPAGKQLTSFQLLELTRRFCKGYLAFKDHPRIIEAKNKIIHYNKLLKIYGLRDHQVKSTEIGGLRAFILFLVRLSAFIVFSMISLPGVILNLPATAVIHQISSKKAKESKLKSDVKIEGKDVLASWKLIVGLILIPTLYIFYTILFYFFISALSLDGIVGKTALFHIFLPFLSYFTVRFQETAVESMSSIKPLFFSIFPSKKEEGLKLRKMRKDLRNMIIDLVNSFGPTLFHDFEQSRLVQQVNHRSHDRRQSDEAISWGDGNVLWGFDKLDAVISDYAYMTEKLVKKMRAIPKPLENDHLDWETVSSDEIDDVFFK